MMTTGPGSSAACSRPNEQQREHQRREYERERRIAKAKEEEARRRLAAFEASSAARQAEANEAVPPKEMRRLSPDTVDDQTIQNAQTSEAAAGSEPVQPAERKAAGTPRQQHSESRTTASPKRSGADAVGGAAGGGSRRPVPRQRRADPALPEGPVPSAEAVLPPAGVLPVGAAHPVVRVRTIVIPRPRASPSCGWCSVS
jgi:hypothetical protein